MVGLLRVVGFRAVCARRWGLFGILVLMLRIGVRVVGIGVGIGMASLAIVLAHGVSRRRCTCARVSRVEGILVSTLDHDGGG